MQTWQALQVLTLAALALFIGAQALPPLRPWRQTLIGAALVLYLAGGAVLLVLYLLGGMS